MDVKLTAGDDAYFKRDEQLTVINEKPHMHFFKLNLTLYTVSI